MRAFVLLALFSICAADIVSVSSTWGTGFEGKFSIRVNKPYDGWKATIKFSSQINVLEIWNAKVESCSGNTCTITNLDWNRQLNVGDTLAMNFVARLSGYDNNAGATITLHGNDGGTVVEPTGGTVTHNPQVTVPKGASNTKYNYNEVLQKSILFYEAQRSGKLPANNRIPWRGNSALQDRGHNGEDLTGGWYDAGDNVKFGLPMAWSVTTLVWGLLEFKDGYEEAGQLDWMYDTVKWPLDYFMKAHTSKYEFYGQLGNGHQDHATWDRPESMNSNRPAYKITSSQPGSEVAAETAAALAAGSIAFKLRDPTYSADLLRHAKELFEFANTYRGTYVDAINDARSFYNSFSGYEDEIVWAAGWLHRATGESSYLDIAKREYKSGSAWTFSWDDKKAGYQLLLYTLTKDSTYKNDVQTFLNNWLPGAGVGYTPKGFAWISEWGPLRYTANTALLTLIAAEQGINPSAYRTFAKNQINYMLGDAGRSLVVGFGHNPPQRPHHRAASCPDMPAPCGSNYLNSGSPNPHVLNGALVGGPDKNDIYTDDRNDFKLNEVATDYNAGFQGAVAGLIHLAKVGQLP